MLYRATIKGGSIVVKKFNRETQNCGRINEEVLFKILKANCKSEIGVKFNFKDIKSVEAFKNKVHLTEYGYYEEYIRRMAKGEKNILTSENVEYFGHTSGTTGKQK